MFLHNFTIILHSHFELDLSTCWQVHKEYKGTRRTLQLNIQSYLNCSESCRAKKRDCQSWMWTLPSHEEGDKCFHFQQSTEASLEDSPAISAEKNCKGKNCRDIMLSLIKLEAMRSIVTIIINNIPYNHIFNKVIKKSLVKEKANLTCPSLD